MDSVIEQLKSVGTLSAFKAIVAIQAAALTAIAEFMAQQSTEQPNANNSSDNAINSSTTPANVNTREYISLFEPTTANPVASTGLESYLSSFQPPPITTQLFTPKENPIFNNAESKSKKRRRRQKKQLENIYNTNAKIREIMSRESFTRTEDHLLNIVKCGDDAEYEYIPDKIKLDNNELYSHTMGILKENEDRLQNGLQNGAEQLWVCVGNIHEPAAPQNSPREPLILNEQRLQTMERYGCYDFEDVEFEYSKSIYEPRNDPDYISDRVDFLRDGSISAYKLDQEPQYDAEIDWVPDPSNIAHFYSKYTSPRMWVDGYEAAKSAMNWDNLLTPTNTRYVFDEQGKSRCSDAVLIAPVANYLHAIANSFSDTIQFPRDRVLADAYRGNFSLAGQLLVEALFYINRNDTNRQLFKQRVKYCSSYPATLRAEMLRVIMDEE